MSIYFSDIVCFMANSPQFVYLYSNASPCFLQQGKETQLLHVFEEDLIFGNERTEDLEETSDTAHSGIVTIREIFRQQCIVLEIFFAAINSILCVSCFLLVSSQPPFSARFFLVVVELTPTGRSLLHMWHLQLTARPVTLG